MENSQLNTLLLAITALNETMTQILQVNKQMLEQMKKTPYSITTNFTQNGSKCKQLTSAQSVIAGCTIKNMTL